MLIIVDRSSNPSMQQCLVMEVANITVIAAWGSIQQCIVRHIWSVVMWYSSRERVFIVQIFLKDPVYIIFNPLCYFGDPSFKYRYKNCVFWVVKVLTIHPGKCRDVVSVYVTTFLFFISLFAIYIPLQHLLRIYCTNNITIKLYVGHLESKERLRIQPAQLFNFSWWVMWCVQ